MLLVAIIWPLRNDAKSSEMKETLAHGYSSESTQQELSSQYQHDRVKMIFKNLCVLVLGTKVASAFEELRGESLLQEDRVSPCEFACSWLDSGPTITDPLL